MTFDDLTVIFLTVNKVPEHWAEFNKTVLLQAIGDTPVITISKKPMDWGTNLIQDAEPSVSNIYRQVLRGAKVAATPYIAIAEDDTLYSEDHFAAYRPPMDTYAFNLNRWGLLTWGRPTYYHKARISNACMIAPRELVIEALEERFKLYPENNIGELGKEKGTRIDRKNTKTYFSTVPIIYFSHVEGLDPTEQHRTKKMSAARAYDIPYWGKAEDLVKHFV
jgi:hypothetical protein